MDERIENRMIVDSEWPEPSPVLYCHDCGEGIGADESYYDIGGDVICDRCIDDYVKLNFRRYANNG